MRQIILDTETTGLSPKDGHRIIEIGCVEMIDRRLTGNNYHEYINPQREVEAEAIEVHGITNEFLSDKPIFGDIMNAFIDFISGAELIIHNAPFDVGFINHEFKLMDDSTPLVESICTICDTLKMARDKYPGRKNSLDALCKRFEIDNSHRELHGALLDSEILADVYLRMTAGQMAFDFGQLELDPNADHTHEAGQTNNHSNQSFENSLVGAKSAKRATEFVEREALPVIAASAAELEAHSLLLDKIASKSGLVPQWCQSLEVE